MTQNIATGNFANFGRLLPLLIPLYFLSFYFTFMQITGILQQALGLRTGSPYYYLTIGKPVWRLMGAVLLTMLMMVMLYLLLILAGVVLGAILALAVKLLHLGRGAAAISGFVVVLTFLAGYCSYFYVVVRLTFLLNPVVIAESRIDFRRSWSLGKGNFWRMFLILLSVIVPVMAVLLLAMYFWYGGFMPMTPIGATPDQIAASRAAAAAWMATGMKRTFEFWYFMYPVSALLMVLMYGLGCGAQCFAYRALVPETPSSANLP